MTTRSARFPRRLAILGSIATAAVALTLPAAPAFADTPSYNVVVSENLGHPYYMTDQRPVDLVPGESVQFVADEGFWTTGPEGDWTLTTYKATFLWEGMPDEETQTAPQKEYPLETSVNATGSTLTVTVPASIADAVPEWPQFRNQIFVEASDGIGTGANPDDQWLRLSQQASLEAVYVPGPDDGEGEGEGGAHATSSAPATSAGGDLVVSGTGFLPGEALDIYLHSDPQHLARTQARDDGSFSITVQIPANTAPGDHLIEVRGTESGSVFIALTVTKPAPTLANTGAQSLPAFALAGGLLLLGGAAAVLIRRTNES